MAGLMCLGVPHCRAGGVRAGRAWRSRSRRRPQVDRLARAPVALALIAVLGGGRPLRCAAVVTCPPRRGGGTALHRSPAPPALPGCRRLPARPDRHRLPRRGTAARTSAGGAPPRRRAVIAVAPLGAAPIIALASGAPSVDGGRAAAARLALGLSLAAALMPATRFRLPGLSAGAGRLAHRSAGP
ncbi:hypothetical protein LV779_17640 [Streptomyces thinghirensis]|nr:hypothetical protein [Streptomyces thinghirensis]